MSWAPLLLEAAVFGNIGGASFPVDNAASDRLDVGVLAAEVEGSGTQSELAVEEDEGVPVGVS